MRRYVLRRLALVVLTLFMLSVLVFLLAQVLPGNVGRTMLGPFASPEQVEAINHELGFDRPIFVRYWDWSSGFVRGDWGESYFFKEPVLPLVMSRLLNSLKLAAVAALLIIPVSVGLGVWAGLRANRRLDRAVSGVGLSLTAIPEFVSGVVLLIVFAVKLHWFPAGAVAPPGSGFFVNVYYLILPAIPLMFVLFGYISRHARAGTLGVLESPYVRAAYLKGLPPRRVVTHHVLRNALPATITVVFLQVAFMITGLAVIEVLFTYPGLGKLTLDAANHHDVPLLQACALLVGVVIVGLNLIADLTHAFMDPRIRLRGQE
jgi:peptide/nickel transport system permease protein